MHLKSSKHDAIVIMTDRHVGELAFLAMIFIMNFEYNEILNILYNTLESWVLGFVA